MIEDFPVRVATAQVNDQGDVVRLGGCSCGKVRFEIIGEPIKVGVCHCTECRKATGAVAMAYADWARDKFSYTGSISPQLLPTLRLARVSPL